MPETHQSTVDAAHKRLPDIFSGLGPQSQLSIAGKLLIDAAQGENAARAGLVKTPERSDKIIGLSKIPRLVDLYARRLQVQEHLTKQVMDALNDLIKPRAVAVRISGQHLCMMMRGVEKQNSFTVSESHCGIERLTNLEQQRLFSALEGKMP
jgi:GTP cyclohydrolase I